VSDIIANKESSKFDEAELHSSAPEGHKLIITGFLIY
jgi:hypothetical protein